jgi:hypothetical protein
MNGIKTRQSQKYTIYSGRLFSSALRRWTLKSFAFAAVAGAPVVKLQGSWAVALSCVSACT